LKKGLAALQAGHYQSKCGNADTTKHVVLNGREGSPV
jgi:hypothetical protein